MTVLAAFDRVGVAFPVGKPWFGAPRRRLQALHDVSFDIAAGETLALVGESGSGKTTLGHVLAGLRQPSAGTVRFPEASPRSGREKIQIVFQDPFGALDPRMPVSAIVAEPLVIEAKGSTSERMKRVAALLDQVGLPRDALNRYPHEFSGGQRQRIAIARALAPEPRLIVADEPLSALDVSIGSQILNLLKDLKERQGLAYLFISHDLGVVNHLADRVAVLYLGRLVELAPRRDLFATPSHPYTAALLAAVPRLGRKRGPRPIVSGEMPDPINPPWPCVFHPRCPRAQAICRSAVPRLEPVPGRPQHFAACHFKD